MSDAASALSLAASATPRQNEQVGADTPLTVRPAGGDVNTPRQAEAPPPPQAAAAPRTGGLSGERFGDYELLGEVARGGMGVVYKARQVSLNRTVALKMILCGGPAGEEEVRRFKAEAVAVARLDHPGIVPIFEVGEHQGQHFFSMGFVEGDSLAQRLASGPLPPREAAALIREIAEAMAYAHSRGVIHRDLKPSNILIDRDGRPRVMDFGIAGRVEDDGSLIRTGQMIGTPSYMPPEQAQGKEEVGPAADVYALGAVLYTLLVGRPPFQAATVGETINQVLTEDPVPPRRLNRTVPHDLEAVCLRCLQKEPARRYAGAADLAEDLRRFQQGRPVLARPAGWMERGYNWCRRHPATAMLLALAVPAAAASLWAPLGFLLALAAITGSSGLWLRRPKG